MAHINFRIDEEIKDIIDLIAEMQGITAAELAKRATLKEISSERVEIAFRLLAEGKIGRKKAWKISGLGAHEFLNEWTRRDAEEKIDEGSMDKELKLISTLDIKKYKGIDQ